MFENVLSFAARKSSQDLADETQGARDGADLPNVTMDPARQGYHGGNYWRQFCTNYTRLGHKGKWPFCTNFTRQKYWPLCTNCNRPGHKVHDLFVKLHQTWSQRYLNFIGRHRRQIGQLPFPLLGWTARRWFQWKSRSYQVGTRLIEITVIVEPG